MKLTREWFSQKGACEEGIDEFFKVFDNPKYVMVSKKNLYKLVRYITEINDFSILEWVVGNYMSDSQVDIYDERYAYTSSVRHIAEWLWANLPKEFKEK